MAKQQHTVPGEVVRATLAKRGVNSVNLATQWAAQNGITPSRVVAIVRGKRARVQFAHADEIATALGSPELWGTDWVDWSTPNGAPLSLATRRPRPGDEVVHEQTGESGVLLWRALGSDSFVVDFGGDAPRVVPLHRLFYASRASAA